MFFVTVPMPRACEGELHPAQITWQDREEDTPKHTRVIETGYPGAASYLRFIQLTLAPSERRYRSIKLLYLFLAHPHFVVVYLTSWNDTPTSHAFSLKKKKEQRFALKKKTKALSNLAFLNGFKVKRYRHNKNCLFFFFFLAKKSVGNSNGIVTGFFTPKRPLSVFTKVMAIKCYYSAIRWQATGRATQYIAGSTIELKF